MDILPKRTTLSIQEKQKTQVDNTLVQGTLTSPALIANNGKVIRKIFSENVNQYETDKGLQERIDTLRNSIPSIISTTPRTNLSVQQGDATINSLFRLENS